MELGEKGKMRLWEKVIWIKKDLESGKQKLFIVNRRI
jgi:hypothetical protein